MNINFTELAAMEDCVRAILDVEICAGRLDENEVQLFKRDLTGSIDYLSWWKERFFI